MNKSTQKDKLKIYPLTIEQINIVNEAKEHINKGQFLTHEKAQLKINQWLNNHISTS